MHTPLSEATRKRVCELFAPEQHSEVVQLLESDCGNNLPFLQNLDAQGLEPVRFAALTISEGSLEKLHSAVELAKNDWRDLLGAAHRKERAR